MSLMLLPMTLNQLFARYLLPTPPCFGDGKLYALYLFLPFVSTLGLSKYGMNCREQTD